jgi:hypothetical protein
MFTLSTHRKTMRYNYRPVIKSLFHIFSFLLRGKLCLQFRCVVIEGNKRISTDGIWARRGYAPKGSYFSTPVVKTLPWSGETPAGVDKRYQGGVLDLRWFVWLYLATNTHSHFSLASTFTFISRVWWNFRASALCTLSCILRVHYLSLS